MEMVEWRHAEESENPSAPDGYDGFPDPRKVESISQNYE
jgi:hypothetical protein